MSSQRPRIESCAHLFQYSILSFEILTCKMGIITLLPHVSVMTLEVNCQTNAYHHRKTQRKDSTNGSYFSNYSYSNPPLSAVLSSVVSLTRGKLQPENIKWKTLEITIHKF